MHTDATTPIDATTKSPEERKAALAQAIAAGVRAGYRVEWQDDFQVVLVRGRRPNHILHLLLTVFTLGFWAIVWIIVAIAGGEKREVVAVDELGRTASVGWASQTGLPPGGYAELARQQAGRG